MWCAYLSHWPYLVHELSHFVLERLEAPRREAHVLLQHAARRLHGHRAVHTQEVSCPSACRSLDSVSMESEQFAGCCMPDAARDIHACGTESYEPPRQHAWQDLQAHPSSSIVSAGKNALDVAQDVGLAMLHGGLQLLDVGHGHGCRDVGAIDEGDLTCKPASLMGIARQLEFKLPPKANRSRREVHEYQSLTMQHFARAAVAVPSDQTFVFSHISIWPRWHHARPSAAGQRFETDGEDATLSLQFRYRRSGAEDRCCRSVH